MDSKIKTGLSETTLRKSPRVTRIMSRTEPNSPSPTRLSLDRSPANPTRSRRVPTPPEKTHTRGVTGSSESSQPRLIQLKEDLRKANEMIVSLENDKAEALDELKKVREEEVYVKLYEALEAQKRAEDNLEIEKFKAVEAGVEAFHRKEEELKKELEIVKNQHASDSAVRLLVTRELEKVTQELSASEDAKNILSSELKRLKALLGSTREKETISKNQIAVLRSELEKARCFEAEIKRRDKIIEKLDGEIEVLKMEKSCAHGSADQWCNKAVVLERQLEEANMMKRSASASIATLTKELEGSNKRAHAMECETTDLKDKVKVMAAVGLRQCQDLGRSQQLLATAEESLSKAEKEAEKLKSELETVKEEKKQASSEACVLREKLLSLGGKDYETQAEHYKKMLEEARHEIDVLVSEVEQTKMREAGLVNHMNRLRSLVKRTKEEADGALKKESQMRDDLKEVEDEVIRLQETLREARAESLKLDAKMLDKETEFQSVLHENDLLRVKQDDSMKKIRELEEALAKKEREEDDGELSESEQDYDLVEILDGVDVKLEESRGEKEDSQDGNDDDDDTVEVEYSMWESYHTGKKEAFHKGK
ncbi:hypothetical protein Bca52824_021394 [Brassica carinata]|uniref:Uncharacterized protein n=1 Tax=Brassica carinata TaxID=52824 RepID=A0A8X7VW28_BRACI|nr:hypothetical protein Bca52824_021394 [Brassica carinata]